MMNVGPSPRIVGARHVPYSDGREPRYTSAPAARAAFEQAVEAFEARPSDDVRAELVAFAAADIARTVEAPAEPLDLDAVPSLERDERNATARTLLAFVARAELADRTGDQEAQRRTRVALGRALAALWGAR